MLQKERRQAAGNIYTEALCALKLAGDAAGLMPEDHDGRLGITIQRVGVPSRSTKTRIGGRGP